MSEMCCFPCNGELHGAEGRQHKNPSFCPLVIIFQRARRVAKQPGCWTTRWDCREGEMTVCGVGHAASLSVLLEPAVVGPSFITYSMIPAL